jgi:hypothetical protein
VPKKNQPQDTDPKSKPQPRNISDAVGLFVGNPTNVGIEKLEEDCLNGFGCMYTVGQESKACNAKRKEIREKMRPWLRTLRVKLSRQGKRDGVDGWQSWFEKHKHEIGCSLRTANRICGDEPEPNVKAFAFKDGNVFKHGGVLYRMDGDVSVRKSGGKLVFTLVGIPLAQDNKEWEEKFAVRLEKEESQTEDDAKIPAPKKMTAEGTSAAITAQEKHTGQHEDDCLECFNFRNEIEAARSKVVAEISKRIQTLINTWRKGRLKSEDKYRVEFSKAASKYERRLAVLRMKYGEIPRLKPDTHWLQDARNRMETAIRDRNQAHPYMLEVKTKEECAADETPTEATVNAE